MPAGPGAALLERATSYTLGSLHLVTADSLGWPTPCRGWDVRALLDHLADSLLALYEAVDGGQVALAGNEAGHDGSDAGRWAADPVGAVRDAASRLLGAWSAPDGPLLVSVGGCPVTTMVVAGTGAVEIALHGWDLARACGGRRPIPESLAEELLALAPLLVTAADRPARFAQPIAVPPLADAGERLVGFLGRPPDWSSASALR